MTGLQNYGFAIGISNFPVCFVMGIRAIANGKITSYRSHAIVNLCISYRIENCWLFQTSHFHRKTPRRTPFWNLIESSNMPCKNIICSSVLDFPFQVLGSKLMSDFISASQNFNDYIVPFQIRAEFPVRATLSVTHTLTSVSCSDSFHTVYVYRQFHSCWCYDFTAFCFPCNCFYHTIV